MENRHCRWYWLACAAFCFALAAENQAAACPFCSGVSITLGEEMSQPATSAAVIAKLVELPKPAPPAENDQPALSTDSKAKFEIVKVLKGKDVLGDARQIEVIYYGQDEKGKTFLIMGEPPIEGASQPTEKGPVVWNTPVALTARAVEYVSKLPDLPPNGPDRLAYFQQYCEDAEEMLARDAYDEFSKAPYAEVKALKDRMNHDQLVAWIKNPDVPPSRRRLYLTMLGICGSKADLPMLEQFINSDDRDMKTALDAVVACYLTLDGADGLPLVEERFLKNPNAEYTDSYAAIMAIRFHGQEEHIIPKQRLVKSLEYMLDRPQYADLVIPDLARWEDWQATDRLVKLFKEANDETSWLRVPVINFLKANPDPKAKAYIDELAKIDPEAVKRASSVFPLAGATPAAVPPADSATTAAAENSSDGQSDAKAAIEDAAKSESPLSEQPEPAAKSEQATSKQKENTDSAAPAATDTDAAPPIDNPPPTGQLEPLVEPPRFSNTPVWLVVVVPLAACGLLLGVFLIVLRGQRHQTNA